MITKQGKKRLELLIALMEKLPPEAQEHFDMGWWVSHKGIHAVTGVHQLEKGLTVKKLMSCGTTACAAAWGATIPALRRAGLKMKPDASLGALTPAVPLAKFFGLDSFSAEHELFGPRSGIITTQDWARKAKRFLDNQTVIDEVL